MLHTFQCVEDRNVLTESLVHFSGGGGEVVSRSLTRPHAPCFHCVEVWSSCSKNLNRSIISQRSSPFFFLLTDIQLIDRHMASIWLHSLCESVYSHLPPPPSKKKKNTLPLKNTWVCGSSYTHMHAAHNPNEALPPGPQQVSLWISSLKLNGNSDSFPLKQVK